jgi:hypothetical protein
MEDPYVSQTSPLGLMEAVGVFIVAFASGLLAGELLWVWHL